MQIQPPPGRPRITFQPTITFGNVISLGAILAGGALAFFNLRTDVALVSDKIVTLEKRLDGMVGRPEFESRLGSLEGTVRIQGYRLDRLVDGPRAAPGHQ